MAKDDSQLPLENTQNTKAELQNNVMDEQNDARADSEPNPAVDESQQTSNENNVLIDQDLLAFSQRINASLQSNMPQSAQTATGEILNLLPEIDKNTPTQIFHNIQIAFTALTQKPATISIGTADY